MSERVRIETGYQLRRLQRGEKLTLPVSRPMPSIGKRRHELRIGDGTEYWRIVYLLEESELTILEVFKKKTSKTPKNIIEVCQKRIKQLKT